MIRRYAQHEKKVLPDSLGLVDFAVGYGSFLGNSNCGRTVIIPAHQKIFFGQLK